MKRFISCFVLLILVMYAVPAESDQSDKVRIGMVGFESKAPGVSQQQASIISDLFTRSLAGSPSITILEREQIKKLGEELKFNMSGLVDMSTAVEIGRIQGLQYMIFGAVTELSEKASAGAIPIPIPRIGGAVVGGGNREAKATIDIRVVRVETSEIVLAISESGSAKNDTSAVYIAGFTYAESEFGGLQSRAIAEAVQRLSSVVRGEIGGDYLHVLSKSSDGVVIDIGSNLGSKEGDLYLVFAEGRSITNMRGEIIGRDKIPLAVIKVNQVSSAHSTCSLAPPSKSDMIQRGDKVEPITAAKAKNIKFADSRPRVRNETIDTGTTTTATPPPVSVTVSGTVVEQPIEQQQVVHSSQESENISTDPAKVINTYSLDPGEKNMRRIAHVNAQRLVNSQRSADWKQAYEAYTELVGSYAGDYLAAYQAGEAARKMKNNDNARTWYDRALSINPNYKPALDAKSKLK